MKVLKYLEYEVEVLNSWNMRFRFKYLEYEVEVFQVVVNTLRGRSGLTGVHAHRLKSIILRKEKIQILKREKSNFEILGQSGHLRRVRRSGKGCSALKITG